MTPNDPKKRLLITKIYFVWMNNPIYLLTHVGIFAEITYNYN